MRSVLSQEEIEKISASQIELRRSGIDPILVSGTDAWEQVNLLLHCWSTPENEDQRVEYIVSYSDGFKEGRWLNLPLFYKMHSGDRFQIDPVLDLGERIIAALEKNLDVHSGNQGSFDAVSQSILTPGQEVFFFKVNVHGAMSPRIKLTRPLIAIREQKYPFIDGLHRLYRAAHMGEPKLFGCFLSQEEAYFCRRSP